MFGPFLRGFYSRFYLRDLCIIIDLSRLFCPAYLDGLAPNHILPISHQFLIWWVAESPKIPCYRLGCIYIPYTTENLKPSARTYINQNFFPQTKQTFQLTQVFHTKSIGYNSFFFWTCCDRHYGRCASPVQGHVPLLEEGFSRHSSCFVNLYSSASFSMRRYYLQVAVAWPALPCYGKGACYSICSSW